MVLHIHIVAASAWLGLVAAETVIELLAKDRTNRQFVAKAHKMLDLYLEAPLVAIVLISGSLLLYQVWPNLPLLFHIKIAAGLIAIVANVLCIYWVLGRAKAKDDAEFLRCAKNISLTGYTIPLAVLALVIGLFAN